DGIRDATVTGVQTCALPISTCVAGDAGKGEPPLRPIEYRDIVILLRSTVHKAEQIAEVLRRFDIPVYRDSGSGYFNTPEVRDLRSEERRVGKDGKSGGCA